MKVCESFAGNEWSYCLNHINPNAGHAFSCDFAGDETKCIFKRVYNIGREKVLDELTEWRENQEYHLGMFHKLEEYERLWREEWTFIKELRQEDKPTDPKCRFGYPIYLPGGETMGIRCQGVKRSQMDTCQSIREKGMCRLERQEGNTGVDRE